MGVETSLTRCQDAWPTSRDNLVLVAIQSSPQTHPGGVDIVGQQRRHHEFHKVEDINNGVVGALPSICISGKRRKVSAWP
jgi:hypothetical protein